MTRSSLYRHIATGADPAEQTARTRYLLRQLADRFGVVPIDLRQVDNLAEREVIQRVAERQGMLGNG